MRLPALIAAVSLVCTPASALAQQAPPQFSADEVRAHVEFLADDLLEGRNAGARGHEIAARYVAARFAAMGLAPGGDSGGWYQQVTIADYGLDMARPATVTIGGKVFENGGDALIAPSPRFGTATQRVSGDAVFVGHGLAADYAGLDVRGRFAVALVGASKGLSPEATRMAAAENKGRNAGARGALGILYLVAPQDMATTWAQAGGAALDDQTRWISPEGFPGGEDPGVAIAAYLSPGAAGALFAGAPRTAAQVFAAGAAGPVPGFGLARRVAAARTSRVRTVRSPNVIGVLRGADPALADEHVVMSAHLDHEGFNRTLKGDRVFNGAMDNAAGVATMLEAARGFVQSGALPRRSILFVALTAEEDGLIGSDYLAAYPGIGAGRIVADVNLDMPILLYDFADVIAFGAEHSTLGPIVANAAAQMGVTVSPDPMPEERFFVRSDHFSFVKRGVPSVFLMTGFANGGEKAFRAFLANHYHQPSDDTTLPFDWVAGAKFARLNYLIAREIADAAEAPRWYRGDVYGERFAKTAAKAPPPAAAAAQ